DPSERDLRRRRLVLFGDAVEQRTGPGQVARRQRIPGNESDAVLLAIVQHVLAAARYQVVLVLHRDDREYLARGLDLLHRDVAQPGLRDHAVIQQRFDGGKLLAAWHLGIDAVKLP